MKHLLLVLTLGLTATTGVARTDVAPADHSARTPVLVELFTSEGCSSCPPADRLLAQLLAGQPVGSADVIPLAFHVDYWDRLGWKDPYASAAFTKRQHDYSRVFGGADVYTPQMVVDGVAQFVGSDDAKASGAIREAAGRPHLAVHIGGALMGESVRLSVEAPAAPAAQEPTDLFVAIVEGGLTSAVRRGENQGKTLPHEAVVRKLESVGAMDGDPLAAETVWRLGPSWQRSQLRVVAFLQGRNTRRIYGAAAAPLK